jgi:hypothetical protein
VRGEPAYAAGSGFDPATNTGRFALAPGSPGAGTGERIPNFSGPFTGPRPDAGAHQRGTPAMRFGVNAGGREPGRVGRHRPRRATRHHAGWLRRLRRMTRPTNCQRQLQARITTS